MKHLYKLVIVALLFAFVGGVAGVDAQSIKDRFDGILVDHDADINGNVDIAGTLDVTGASTFTGAATFSDAQTFTGAAGFSSDVQAAGILGLTPTSYALTGTQTLTPAVTYYELAPPAVLTLTLGAGTAGDLLILANTVATNAVIIDTGATVGGSNVTLAENDIVVFLSVDGTWAEVASPDNS